MFCAEGRQNKITCYPTWYVGKKAALEIRRSGYFSALLFTTYVTLDKLIHISVPQFNLSSSWENRDNYLKELL